MSMEPTPDDLLPGEKHILTKGANLMVSLQKEHLSKLAFAKYTPKLGEDDADAVGGKAHLTNYRLLFKSHWLNRMRGSSTVWLPNVTSVNSTFLRLVIATQVQRFEYVMWFKKEMIAAIQSGVSSFNQAKMTELKESLLAKPEALGSGLQKWVKLDSVCELLNVGKELYSVFDDLSDSDKRGLLELLTVFKK